MDLPNQILISIFCLFSLLTIVYPTIHEKQFRTHSLIPIANVNCETIRFRTLSDKCYRTHAKYPVKGSCTKYIHCYRNENGELVPGEEECNGGTIFHSKWKTCGYSETPSICLQTQCGGTTSGPSKKSDDRRPRHPPHAAVPNQKPPQPLNCGPDEEEDEEELEFGKIPKQCPPGKVGNDDQAPNWDKRPTSAPNQSPSNMNGFYSPRGPSPEQVPDWKTRSQGSTGFGNREAGRPQIPGYGNREAGRGQGGNTAYGNRDGQGQWQWPTNEETATRKPDTDKYGVNNGYPAFPGTGDQKPDISTRKTTSTKKPSFQEQEEEEFNKEQHWGENSEPGHEEEQYPGKEEPVQQSQVQNSSDSAHRKMEAIIMIFTLFVSLNYFRF